MTVGNGTGIWKMLAYGIAGAVPLMTILTIIAELYVRPVRDAIVEIKIEARTNAARLEALDRLTARYDGVALRVDGIEHLAVERGVLLPRLERDLLETRELVHRMNDRLLLIESRASPGGYGRAR